jgi:hypothetical protein
MQSISIDPRRLNLSPAKRKLLAEGIIDDALVQSLQAVLAEIGPPAAALESGQTQVSSENDQMLLEVPLSYEQVLRGGEWGVVDGVTIDVPGSIRLRIDRARGVEECVFNLPDAEDIQSAIAHVRGLLVREEIASATISPSSRTLMALGKHYFVAVDESGRKRLQRAFMSTNVR